MDYEKIILETNNLIESIKQTPEYKKLVGLKKEIDLKYADEISRFKDANDKYCEALKYGDYHPSLVDYKKDFIQKKSVLYSKEEVQEYFKLEKQINDELSDITNKISSVVSNKYKI